MKKLFIPFIDQDATNNDAEKVASLLDVLPTHQIDYQAWPQFKSDLRASFRIAHTNDAIWLKYEVGENAIGVTTFETNGSVHHDNCVEFFVSFGAEQSYYNIEINCVGIVLIAYGAARTNRTFLPKQLVEKIRTHSIIRSAATDQHGRYAWEVSLIIPKEIFMHSNLNTFSHQTGHGNFFKCGDDLPEPHFLSWTNIEAEHPDFHLPEFFGELEFG
jgi:hypothetical protein